MGCSGGSGGGSGLVLVGVEGVEGALEVGGGSRCSGCWRLVGEEDGGGGACGGRSCLDAARCVGVDKVSCFGDLGWTLFGMV